MSTLSNCSNRAEGKVLEPPKYKLSHLSSTTRLSAFSNNKDPSEEEEEEGKEERSSIIYNLFEEGERRQSGNSTKRYPGMEHGIILSTTRYS
jgi:hypothetical protein